MKTVLLATIHHPNISLPQLKQITAATTKIFSAVYVTISTVTSPEITQLLTEETDFHCQVITPHGAADARRKVLDFCLQDVDYQANLFYCDFDKVLTAMLTARQTLKIFVAQLQLTSGYCIIGRNAEVMASYPATWRETEAITNKAAAVFFSLPNLDITAGCCAFSQNAARYIVANSHERLTDTEWPVICKAAGLPILAARVGFLPFNEQLNAGRDDHHWHGYTARLALALQALQSLEQGDVMVHKNLPVKSAQIGWPFNLKG